MLAGIENGGIVEIGAWSSKLGAGIYELKFAKQAANSPELIASEYEICGPPLSKKATICH